MHNIKILMIEDDPIIRDTNYELLVSSGYQVFTADTLEEGKVLALKHQPELIILDILLPDGNGLVYCREQLRNSNTKILFLSALNTKEDVIAGLRAGGDDYLPKPYLMEELLARIEALLRRKQYLEKIVKGNLVLDVVKRKAYIGKKELALTPTQFSLLLYLAYHEGKIIHTEKLYEEVWGTAMHGDSNAVKTAISHVRHRIQRADVTIVARRGVGYQLKVEKRVKGKVAD